MEASAPAMANVDEASSFRSTSVVSERWLVNKAHQAEKFEERVLQRRGCEQERWHVFERLLERVGDDVRGLIDVAQPMCLINHHQVPRRVVNVGSLLARKLVGANDNL